MGVVNDRPAHFLRALGWFRAAGFTECTARTFVGDAQAPLSAGIRRSLILLFEMLWADAQPDAPADDWLEYQRLCRSESPDFILNLPDYYAFFTYTMFQGKVSPQKRAE